MSHYNLRTASSCFLIILYTLVSAVCRIVGMIRVSQTYSMSIFVLKMLIYIMLVTVAKIKKTSRADYDFLCPSLFTCVCRQSCRNRQIRVRILHRQATCKMTLSSNLCNDWRNLLQHKFFGYRMWCCVAKGAAMGLRSQGSCIFSVYAWRRHSIRRDSEWQL